MSYNIYLYHPDVKTAASAGVEIDEINLPAIPDDVRNRFVERLLKYDYEFEAENANRTEYIHKNRNWSILVAVFPTEIAFSVSDSDDFEDAIFEALQTAQELADTGELVVYDPQTGEWGDL